VAGWGIGGSVYLQTVGSKVRLFGQWVAAVTNSAAPPSVIAGQYATSNRSWSGFPCKWRYINVTTFNLYYYFQLLFHTCQYSQVTSGEAGAVVRDMWVKFVSNEMKSHHVVNIRTKFLTDGSDRERQPFALHSVTQTTVK